MTKDEQFILTKAAVMADLEKRGGSIEEFENFLVTKAADESVMKYVTGAADRVGSAFKPAVSWFMDQAPAAVLGGSLLAGTTLGGAAYGAKRSLDKEDSALEDRQAEVNRYKQLTGRIKSDYGL